MIFFSLLLLTVFENAVVQSDNFPPLQLNPVGQQQENTLTPRFNYFDLELVQSFDDRQNYFISPASIKATLGMVLEGARGQCAKEIGAALRIPVDQAGSRDKLRSLLYDFNTKSESTFIESANGAFVSNVYRVLPEYKRNLKEYYKAEVVPLNFSNVEAAASYMNTWVKDVTRGLITDIITTENFNSDATLVIANALYFKGKWKSEFDEKSTSLQCFKSSRSSCIHAKMMQNVDKFRYKFIEDIDAQAIELPYGDEQYAMLVLLPSEKNSVDGVQRDLQFIPFASIVNRLEKTEVSLTLPKFEIDYSADIVADLQRLGIKEIFGPKANLSGIIADAQIKINNIVHQAKVEVNEKGTVAAGATGVIVIPLMGTSTPRFIADRPFLFFIYNRNSKNILFAGRFNNPKETYDEIFGGPTSFSSNTQNRKYAVPNKDAVALSLENQGNKQGTKSKPSYAAVAAQPIYFQQDTVTQPRESSNYQIFRSSPYNRNYDNYREPFSENGGAFVNQ